MLWVAFCLLLLHNVAADNQVCDIYTGATEEGFKTLALVGLSQNLPDSTIEELAPLIEEAKTLAIACCSETPTEDCERDPADLFQSAVCSSETLVEKNHLEDCCNKTGTNRTDCFVEHKSKIPHDMSLHPELPAQEQCDDFNKGKNVFIGSFVFSFSKRHPMLQPQIVMSIAKGYGDVLTSCCSEADPQPCFDTKKAAYKADVRNYVTKTRSVCVIYKKYGDRVLKAKKLVEYSQKVPQATLEEAISVVDRILSTIPPCCHGDMIKCMKEKKEQIDQVCADEKLISRTTGLAECCKKDVTSRSSCIVKMKADPKPDDLSEHFEWRADVTPICTIFNETPDNAMAKMIFEVSRRHPEASEGTILRYAKKVEQAFVNCCAQPNQNECVSTALEGVDLDKDITENNAFYTAQCDKKTALGSDAFEKGTLVRYTMTMPQADFELLNGASERVTSIFDECCDGDNKAACTENKLTEITDMMCNDYEPFNPQVADCCSQSYSERRPCITAMKPASFKAPPLDMTSFPMLADICDKTDHDLLDTQKKLLYTIVRQKTAITEEQLTDIRTEFKNMKTKCCAEEDHDACFRPDVEKLIVKINELSQN